MTVSIKMVEETFDSEDALLNYAGDNLMRLCTPDPVAPTLKSISSSEIEYPCLVVGIHLAHSMLLLTVCPDEKTKSMAKQAFRIMIPIIELGEAETSS